MFIDAVHIGDEILTWVRDSDGELHFVQDDAPYYLYKEKPDDAPKTTDEYKSLFGERLERLDFKDKSSYYNFIRANSGLWESDFTPLYKYLSDNFYNLDVDGPVNVGFFDIEAETDLSLEIGYPTPENPYAEINGISLFDARTKTYHMLTLDKKSTYNLKLDDDEHDGHEVCIYYCVTEKQLLNTFFKLIDDIDVLVGWNSKMYDIPYIMERSKRYYSGNKWLAKMCRNGFKALQRDDFDRFGNPCITYRLTGRIHLDLMDLYIKFVQKVRPSYSLDAISELELGENKIDYPGDLGDLYRADPQKFYEYSLHDTRLLVKLEEKKKFVDLAITMARQATIRFDEVTGSIKYLEHSIRNYAHFDRKEVVILPDRNDDNRKGNFKGAFVVPTIPGVYGWTMSIDLASLYPSTIRALNISPETHIFQCKNRTDDFLLVAQRLSDEITLIHVPTGDEIILPAYEIYDMLRENDFTITANGSILSNELGLLPEILGVWYQQRKEMKDLAKKYEMEGDMVKFEFYDTRQNLRKVNLNSLYGAISNASSRFYSLDLAASVTLSGQVINKFQIWKSDQLIKEAANGNV